MKIKINQNFIHTWAHHRYSPYFVAFYHMFDWQIVFCYAILGAYFKNFNFFLNLDLPKKHLNSWGHHRRSLYSNVVYRIFRIQTISSSCHFWSHTWWDTFFIHNSLALFCLKGYLHLHVEIQSRRDSDCDRFYLLVVPFSHIPNI